MPRATNEQILAEVKRLEASVERHAIEEALRRSELRDDIEKELEKKMKDYVLQVVFQAELKPIKQFMAGVITALVSVAGGLGLWLITRS